MTDLLTPTELAARWKVSRSKIYQLISRGELQCAYIGRLPRISEAHIADYLAEVQK